MNKKLKLWELQRPTVDMFKQQKKFPIIVILDNIRSLSNVGAVFRTCDAFNVETLILGGITPKPPHREIQKTALGATESVDWKASDQLLELVRQYKKEGYFIYSVEQTSKTTFLQNIEIKAHQKNCLIFGNEVDGVSQELIDLSDLVIEIPQFGTKHSLNIAVCTGVVLWEFVREIQNNSTIKHIK